MMIIQSLSILTFPKADIKLEVTLGDEASILTLTLEGLRLRVLLKVEILADLRTLRMTFFLRDDTLFTIHMLMKVCYDLIDDNMKDK